MKPLVLNSTDAPGKSGSSYPAAIAAGEKCRARFKRPLGDAFGLTQFGVNRTTLAPGVWSTVRHWHTAEDEFVVVLEGELILVTDGGESAMRAGDCIGFKAGIADGHRLENRSEKDAVYLEIGSRRQDDITHYSDEDLLAANHKDGSPNFTRRDGSPIK